VILVFALSEKRSCIVELKIALFFLLQSKPSFVSRIFDNLICFRDKVTVAPSRLHEVHNALLVSLHKVLVRTFVLLISMRYIMFLFILLSLVRKCRLIAIYPVLSTLKNLFILNNKIRRVLFPALFPILHHDACFRVICVQNFVFFYEIVPNHSLPSKRLQNERVSVVEQFTFATLGAVSAALHTPQLGGSHTATGGPKFQTRHHLAPQRKLASTPKLQYEAREINKVRGPFEKKVLMHYSYFGPLSKQGIYTLQLLLGALFKVK